MDVSHSMRGEGGVYIRLLPLSRAMMGCDMSAASNAPPTSLVVSMHTHTFARPMG